LQKLTCQNQAAINEDEPQVHARYSQFIPIAYEKVELNPVLSVVCECGELLENKQHNTHSEQYENSFDCKSSLLTFLFELLRPGRWPTKPIELT
jgi:hypothetical protein